MRPLSRVSILGIKGGVVTAAVRHFADWYLRYWRPVPRAEEAAYRPTMLEVDPVTFTPDMAVPILLQFGDADRFVDDAAVDAWRAAVPSASSTIQTYVGNHRLRVDQARVDRADFLTEDLDLD